MSTSTRSPVIIGVLSRLDPDVLVPFVSSLRSAGFDGRLLIAAAQYHAKDLVALEQLVDVVVPVDNQFPAHPPTGAKLARRIRSARRYWTLYERAFQAAVLFGVPTRERERWRGLEYHLEGLQAMRYSLYLEILESLAPDATEILLTDLRDVIFQRNPFNTPISGLEVFLEDHSQTIGGDYFNRRWIRDLYGDSGLQPVAAEIVSCSGTVIGDRRSILDYLSKMTAEVDRAIRSWKRPLGSHDQGIHNWLLYSGKLPASTLVRNGHGRVLTMGAMTRFDTDPSGAILNADGTTPAVLHQYDRHPEIGDALRQLLTA